MKLAPIPSLLATAGVHHHLVREGLRNRAALVIESGDAREVHHLALLIGYGAGAVNPYLAFETLDNMIRERNVPGLNHEKAIKNYIKALNKGVLKVMSKMGISTLQSYRGAQIFEAVGLDKDFVDRYFTWTARGSAGSASMRLPKKCASGTSWRFRRALSQNAISTRAAITNGGATGIPSVQPRYCLQAAARRREAAIQDLQGIHRGGERADAKRAPRLRGLFELKLAATPIPLEEVEPVENILKRFATGRCPTGRSARRRTRRWLSR